MTRQTTIPRGGVTLPVIVAAITGTFALALGAFLLSFAALRDLAALAGVPAGQAWLWPLIVDGVILEATISVVALRDGAAPARRFAWLLLASGAGVSVAANITHALVTSDDRVPALVAALVASVPPLVLVAMTHLTVELIRNTTPTPPTHAAVPEEAAAALVELTAVGAAAGRSVPALPSRATTVGHGPDAGGVSARELRERRRREAARLAAEKVPVREIADRFEVHPTTVARWLNAPDSATPERSDDEHDNWWPRRADPDRGQGRPGRHDPRGGYP